MMKKLLLIGLIFCLLLPLTSCKGPYSDEEAAEILDTLLKREANLNGYIYFDSFELLEEIDEEDKDSGSVTVQDYRLVKPDSSYRSIESLKSEVDAIIAKEWRDEIYGFAFDGVSDGDTVSRPSRFHEDEEGLKIDINNDGYEGHTLALLGSAKVKRSNKTHIRVEITTYRFRDGKLIEHIKEVEVIFEDGAWKMKGQTYIAGVTDTVLISK